MVFQLTKQRVVNKTGVRIEGEEAELADGSHDQLWTNI